MTLPCKIFAILALGGVCSIGLGDAAEQTDTATACEADAQEESAQEGGHALLSTRSKLHRVTAGAHASPAKALTKELWQLSSELPAEQVEQMVHAMRNMQKENLQLVQTQAQAGTSQEPTDAPLMGSAPADAISLPEPKEAPEHTYVLAKFVVVPISIVFFIVYNLATVMEKYEITAIPESAIVIAIGVLLGIFMKKFSHINFFEDEDTWANLNSALLNLIFLPIIIFAGGWSLRRQDFYSQLPYILLFAVVGTAISTCVIAGLIWMTGQYQLHNVVRWRTAFAFASLISATDPVATLTTYTKLQVQPILNIMVFGESTINDAVAIVLFKIFNSNELMIDAATKQDLYLSPQLLGNICFGIFKGFFGSALMGVFLGMLYTLIARAADMKTNKKGQILVIFVSCFLTYGLAESVHLSGIIAEIFCSLVMGCYMRPHLSGEGCALTTFFMKQLSTLADSAIFLLVGVSVVQLTQKGWGFGLWVMLFCLIARFCATVPIALTVNALKAARGTAAGQERKDWNLLTPQHIFMMWHAGLRGGIALALAWELGGWVDVAEGPGTRHALQTATFLVILVFLVVFGGTTSVCLKYMGIPIGTHEAEDVLSKTEYKGLGGIQGFLHHLDTTIFVPLLVGKNPEVSEDGDIIEEPEDDVEDSLKKSMALHQFCQH